MIPLRDNVPSGRAPIVTYAIIAANIAVFLYEIGMPPGVRGEFFSYYGIVPIRYSNPAVSAHFGFAEQVLPFVTSMFLHGGFLHILGNMWILWIFGDNVEDWFGHGAFALFYLFCGVASGLMHLFFNWGSNLPTIGASGAIAGVMGAYFLLYPNARVLTLVPIFVFIQFIELPAFIFLGLWFLLQFLSGAASMGAGNVGGIAWWAHIGGFIAGAAVVFVYGGGRPTRLSRSGVSRKTLGGRGGEFWR